MHYILHFSMPAGGPPPMPSASNGAGGGRSALLDSIRLGKNLKKAAPKPVAASNDAGAGEGDDRGALMASIRAGANLRSSKAARPIGKKVGRMSYEGLLRRTHRKLRIALQHLLTLLF